MLSKAACAYGKAPLVRLQQRFWFDYVKYANGEQAGKTVKEMEEEDAVAATKKKSDHFSWSFVDWFQKHKPERVNEWNTIKNQYNQFESYLRGADTSGNKNDIVFAEFREKIADPKFVDDAEIEYHLQKNALQSITNMNTLAGWDSKKIDTFEEEFRKNGDLLWKPLTEQQKLEMLNRTKAAEEEDAKQKVMAEELQKDYEQLDAERMCYVFFVLGHETLSMRLSQHPRSAESTEDFKLAKQFFYDYFMHPAQMNQIKKMKLQQFQDANRRKLFLERI
ncbi:hypothetical protein RFI_32905 [Reticulomyxa filosa]|uniref:Uncharacterized protein n=1 Tax=Reticulomyxa filosa TaxID=46433 RepID=X6LTQ8_RETFI|nr:hypothetical protein RFI_32905 [Reticulomyxa filosa]|eukprot:ETO04492.1 hypothetical protein RFI_32905 [Reticulomyxa filosa]